MGKAPAFQFYPNDWSRDLEEHPLEIEGAWIRICCKLWWSETKGKITKTSVQWARILRVVEVDSNRILKYIGDEKIGNVTECNGSVTVINRRMCRDEKEREKTRLRVQKHRNTQGTKETSNGVVTVPSSSSSSSSVHSLPKGKPAKAGHFEFTIQDKETLDQLLELAEAVRKQLPKFNPYQFIQKHKTTHPEALLKAFISLNVLVSIKGETPKSGAYPYLTKIIKVEGPNYTEREAIAKHKVLTGEMRKWVKEMK